MANIDRLIKSSAEKYRDKLKSMLKSIEAGTFVAKTFIKTNGMQSNFIEACVVEGIIKPVDKMGRRVVYEAGMPSEEVMVIDAERVMNTLSQIRKRIRDNKTDKIVRMSMRSNNVPYRKEIEARAEKPNIVIPEPEVVFVIPDYADMEDDKRTKLLQQIPVAHMIVELRARGYEGTVSRMEEYVIQQK